MMRHKMEWEHAQEGVAAGLLAGMGAEIAYSPATGKWYADFYGPGWEMSDEDADALTDEQADELFQFEGYEATTLHELLLNVRAGRKDTSVSTADAEV